MEATQRRRACSQKRCKGYHSLAGIFIRPVRVPSNLLFLLSLDVNGQCSN